MAEGQLLVAEEGPMALMQVIGRGTFKLAVGFKSWIEQLIASTTVRTVMLDLSKCTSLDSTFMGLMVTLAIQSKKRFALLVVNATQQHHQLLDGIGVMRVWRYVDTAVPEMNWTSLADAVSGSVALDNATRELIVAAHKTLMEVDERNIPKFKDVVEMMQSEK